MTRRIRVLVVDDAVAVRRAVSDALSQDSKIEVVGTAANGRIALAKLDRLEPDVVILDVEMPEMDGLKTLVSLRESYPRLPVIMFSSYTERGAAATLDALSLGATDYVTKPSALGIVEGVEPAHEELIRKIRGVAEPVLDNEAGAGTTVDHTGGRRTSAKVGRVDGDPWIVAIGASTGGPNALSEILGGLPGDLPAPVLIVQHMPALFTRLLARRLDALCRLPVREAEDGVQLEAGQVWVARGDWHLEVERSRAKVRIRNHRRPPQHSCRPAVDVLLCSVAQSFGRYALAVVLTGMGRDGLRGCEEVRARGGEVLVQDQESSVVWGMPGFIAAAGLANQVVPLADLSGEIVRRVTDCRRPEESAYQHELPRFGEGV
jgi:two-component system chemotaxis response regulator CheB